MSYTRQIIFSLLCISNISLPIDSTMKNGNPRPPININPPLPNPIETISETEIEEMELVFKYSPLEAQLFINHLQDTTYFPDDKDYRVKQDSLVHLDQEKQ